MPMFPFSGRSSAKTTTKKCRFTPRTRVQLAVEQLEDRVVPSTLIPVSAARDLVYDPVRNQLDIVNGGSV